MGGQASREQELLKRLKGLYKDNRDWRAVYEQFVQLVPEDHSLKSNETKLLTVLLDLLRNQLTEKKKKDSDSLCLILDASLRFLRVKGLYKQVAKQHISPFVDSLRVKDDEVTIRALKVVQCILNYKGKTRQDKSEMMKANKDKFDEFGGFKPCCELLAEHGLDGNPDIVSHILQILTLVLTTDIRTTSYDAVVRIITLLESHLDLLLTLSVCNNSELCYYSTVLLQSLVLHTSIATHAKIQKKALVNGALLKHFYTSCYGKVDFDDEKLGVATGSHAKLIKEESRKLVGYFVDGNADAHTAMRNALPKRLVTDNITKPFTDRMKYSFNFARPSDPNHRKIMDSAAWHRYETGKLKRDNFVAVFTESDTNHNTPDLIWNDTTREELQMSLVTELEEFKRQQGVLKSSDWDWEGFESHYPSLDDELNVDGYYLRLLLPALGKNSSYEIPPNELKQLVINLYNRAVIEDKMSWKLGCLRVISALFDKYRKQLKELEPLPYFVWLMDPRHTHPFWRDHIMKFFPTLLLHTTNAKAFVREGGMNHLREYIDECHRRPIPDILSSDASEDETDVLEIIEPSLPPIHVTDMSVSLVLLLIEKIPRLRKQISRHNIFRSLVQVLICGDDEIHSKTVPLLLNIIKSSPIVVSKLARTGIFIYLFYGMKQTCLLEAAQILNYHSHQDNEFVKDGESALEFILPFPMIRMLENEGPANFVGYMDSEDLIERPDLIWGPELRKIMLQQINEIVDPILVKLGNDPSAEFKYQDFPKFKYPPIDSELCIAGMYLRLFNLQPDYAVRDPPYLMEGLVETMALDLHDEYMKDLLESQITMVRRFPPLASARCYPRFDVLLALLSRNVESEMDYNIANAAADLAFVLLTMKESENRSRCVESHGVSAIAVTVLQLVARDFDDPVTQELLRKNLSILNILCFKNEPALNTVADQDRLLIEVSRLYDAPMAEKHPGIAISALLTISTLADSSILQEKLLGNGAILFLVNLCVFYPGDNQKLPQVVQAAANALKTFPSLSEDSSVSTEFKESGREINKHVCHVLKTLLTTGLYVLLKNPKEFLAQARSDAHNPIIIWNQQTRDELQAYIEEQLPDIRETGQWKNATPEKFFFTHSGIRAEIEVGEGEIIVDGVYLRLYNEGAKVFALPHPKEGFMVSLLHSIDRRAQGIRKMKSLEEKEPSFDYVSVVGRSLARLTGDHQFLLKSNEEDINLIVKLMHDEDRDMQQVACLALEGLANNDMTISFVEPLTSTLHALVNLPREPNTQNPDIILALHIIQLITMYNDTIAMRYFDSGIIVSLIQILSGSEVYQHDQRVKASELLGVLANSVSAGDTFRLTAKKLLSLEFDAHVLNANKAPEELVSFYDTDHDSPRIYWNESCREDLLAFIEMDIEPITDHQSSEFEAKSDQVEESQFRWQSHSLDERFDRKTINSQLCIDDIYIHALNANPFFNVDTERFFVKLFEGLEAEFQFYMHVRDRSLGEYDEEDIDMQDPPDPTGSINHAINNLLALWETVRNLLTNLPHLQDRCIPELSYIFSYFDYKVARPLRFVVLDIASTLAMNPGCAQNIARLSLLKDVLPLLVTMRKDPGKIMIVLDFGMNLLRRSSPAVNQIKCLGGVVLILSILLSSDYETAERQKGAMIISAMVQDDRFGSYISDYTVQFLTESFREKFSARPDLFVDFVDSEHKSDRDDREWGPKKLKKLVKLLKKEGKEIAKVMSTWDGNGDIWDPKCLEAIWGPSDNPKPPRPSSASVSASGSRSGSRTQSPARTQANSVSSKNVAGLPPPKRQVGLPTPQRQPGLPSPPRQVGLPSPVASNHVGGPPPVPAHALPPPSPVTTGARKGKREKRQKREKRESLPVAESDEDDGGFDI